jgi:hypothetical protein
MPMRSSASGETTITIALGRIDTVRASCRAPSIRQDQPGGHDPALRAKITDERSGLGALVRARDHHDEFGTVELGVCQRLGPLA